MMRRHRLRREVPAGSLVNVPAPGRRAGGLGNQARLRRLGPPPGPELMAPMVAIAHNDPGAPDSTVNVEGLMSDEVTGGEGPDAGAAEGTQAPPPSGPAPAPAPPPAAPAAPACQCEVASGPIYTPGGAIPVTTSGGMKSATFNMAASFVNSPSTGKPASCCHVRQFIKWNSAFATWRGGPPHAGFGSTPPDTWVEDRNADDSLRYGHRSPPHYYPASGCGNEYKTGGAQDMANGDTFCGRDSPGGPASRTAPDGTVMPRVGVYSFQLKVIDSAGTVKQSGPVITVTWG